MLGMKEMMYRVAGLSVAAGLLGLITFSAAPTPATAQGVGLAHPASSYYRGRSGPRSVRGPQVRGFAQRRVGGYSFYRADTINTYGNVRSAYGGYNVYRDFNGTDRQTPFGPFDHGFFFESGIAPHGGFAPYNN